MASFAKYTMSLSFWRCFVIWQDSQSLLAGNLLKIHIVAFEV